MNTTADRAKRLQELEQERLELLNQQNQDREAYKKLVEEKVPLVVANLVAVEKQLIAAKAEVFSAFKDIIELKASVFGVKDNQQSHTFRSGDNVVKIGYRINDGWDDSVTSGIEKVQNFIQKLGNTDDNEKENMVSAILRLLKADKKGNLNASRVLELQQMAKEFNDAELLDGVSIILDSHQPTRSVWFIEAEQPDEVKGTRPIGLAISSVGFPEGFNFDFLSTTIKETPDA